MSKSTDVYFITDPVKRRVISRHSKIGEAITHLRVGLHLVPADPEKAKRLDEIATGQNQ